MKRKLLLVYVLLAFVLICTNVYAIVTANLNLVADKSIVKPGEDVIVTVELKNLSSTVSSIEGYINIDENILDSISSDMIVVDNNGKIEVKTQGELSNSLSFAYNPSIADADYDVIFNTSESATNGNDVFFVMDFQKDLVDDSEIMQLKYKVKDGIADTDVRNAVNLDCVVVYAADASDRSNELTANLDIKVSSTREENTVDNTNTNKNTNTNTNKNTNTNTNKNTNTNTNGNTNTNKNTNTNTNTNRNTNTNKNTNTNTNRNTNTNKNTNTNTNKNTNTKDNTVSGSKIPAAGIRTVMLPIIVFMVLAYISYRKYLDYKDV